MAIIGSPTGRRVSLSIMAERDASLGCAYACVGDLHTLKSRSFLGAVIHPRQCYHLVFPYYYFVFFCPFVFLSLKVYVPGVANIYKFTSIMCSVDTTRAVTSQSNGIFIDK